MIAIPAEMRKAAGFGPQDTLIPETTPEGILLRPAVTILVEIYMIALPVDMRKAAGIRPQDTLIAETTPEGILLRPAVTPPVEIYTPGTAGGI